MDLEEILRAIEFSSERLPKPFTCSAGVARDKIYHNTADENLDQ
jgi:hypothetical protein